MPEANPDIQWRDAVIDRLQTRVSGLRSRLNDIRGNSRDGEDVRTAYTALSADDLLAKDTFRTLGSNEANRRRCYKADCPHLGRPIIEQTDYCPIASCPLSTTLTADLGRRA